MLQTTVCSATTTNVLGIKPTDNTVTKCHVKEGIAHQCLLTWHNDDSVEKRVWSIYARYKYSTMPLKLQWKCTHISHTYNDHTHILTDLHTEQDIQVSALVHNGCIIAPPCSNQNQNQKSRSLQSNCLLAIQSHTNTDTNQSHQHATLTTYKQQTKQLKCRAGND